MNIKNVLKLFSLILLCSLGTKTLADDVWIAQRLLTQLGYSPGPADGLYGRKTRAALDTFTRIREVSLMEIWIKTRLIY